MTINTNKGLTSLADMFKGEATSQQNEKRSPSEIEVSKLVPFKNHPFKLYTGARLDDMVRSVKEYGVLTPLLVRKQGAEQYEILSGHNRWNAAKIAGLDKVPIILLENIENDEEAMLIVTETNLIQRSFNDLLLSERACVLAKHYDALKSQGKRIDLIDTVKKLLNADEMGDEPTSGQVVQKLDSREKAAGNYDLSGRTVARYLRLNNLIQELKDFIDEGDISFTAGVEISYITEENQSYLAGFLNSGQKIDLEKAKKLHELENKNRLNELNMQKVLEGTYKPKKPKSILKGIKLKPVVMKKYFHEDQKAEEVEEIIDKALEFYYQSHHQGGAD